MPIQPAEFPAPTSEFFERAAHVATQCGWDGGILNGACPTVMPHILDPERKVPCCVNGHLMMAAGVRPNYAHYDSPTYRPIVEEVLATIRASDPRRIGRGRTASPANRLEWWNDQRATATTERQVLRLTAARLREQGR
jgi:hypothetical protein